MYLQDKTKINFLLMGILLLMMLLGFSVQAHASWVENEDGTYSYQKENGTIARGKWIKKKFYVNKEGIRVTGKQKIGSKWYYFSPSNGKLQKKRWIKDGESRYYAGKNGVLYAKGLYTIDQYNYLFDENAVVQTGKQSLYGKTYYFKPKKGRMLKNGWVKINKYFYYFDANGVMVANRWLIGTYYMDAKGRRVTDKWIGARYLGSDGRVCSGLHDISGTYYYFDPGTRNKVTDRLITIDGKRWYFDDEGKGSLNIVLPPSQGVRVQSQYYTHRVVDDETLLSYIIYCEAGNQPYAGKLAVGYVIMNRVYSQIFPASTVREVVYQSGQFSPVWNSMLDRVLNDPTVVNAECKAAAKAVMKKRAKFASGKTVKLNVDGTKVDFPHLYFLSPSDYWSRGMSSSHIQIGGHIFFSQWR